MMSPAFSRILEIYSVPENSWESFRTGCLIEVIAQKRSNLQQVWEANVGDSTSDHLMEIIGVVPSALKIRKDSVR